MSGAAFATGWVQDYLLAQMIISDTNTHTYLTDPYNKNTGYGIKLLPVGTQIPSIKSWSVAIYNNSNQTLTAQLLGSINELPNLPYQIGSSVSINSGQVSLLVPSPEPFPSPYVSVQLSFSTAPTSRADITKPYNVVAYLILIR
jgi:hypothetical protein